MRLLLDEMLSPAIARQLLSRGHDVEPVAGNPDREALSDPGVLALARSEHRAIVTRNLRDFRQLHHEAITPGGAGHFGMIFIPGKYRRTKADTGTIVAALEAILVATLARTTWPTARHGCNRPATRLHGVQCAAGQRICVSRDPGSRNLRGTPSSVREWLRA